MKGETQMYQNRGTKRRCGTFWVSLHYRTSRATRLRFFEFLQFSPDYHQLGWLFGDWSGGYRGLDSTWRASDDGAPGASRVKERWRRDLAGCSTVKVTPKLGGPELPAGSL